MIAPVTPYVPPRPQYHAPARRRRDDDGGRRRNGGIDPELLMALLQFQASSNQSAEQMDLANRQFEIQSDISKRMASIAESQNARAATSELEDREYRNARDLADDAYRQDMFEMTEGQNDALTEQTLLASKLAQQNADMQNEMFSQQKLNDSLGRSGGLFSKEILDWERRSNNARLKSERQYNEGVAKSVAEAQGIDRRLDTILNTFDTDRMSSKSMGKVVDDAIGAMAKSFAGGMSDETLMGHEMAGAAQIYSKLGAISQQLGIMDPSDQKTYSDVLKKLDGLDADLAPVKGVLARGFDQFGLDYATGFEDQRAQLQGEHQNRLNLAREMGGSGEDLANINSFLNSDTPTGLSAYPAPSYEYSPEVMEQMKASFGTLQERAAVSKDTAYGGNKYSNALQDTYEGYRTTSDEWGDVASERYEAAGTAMSGGHPLDALINLGAGVGNSLGSGVMGMLGETKESAAQRVLNSISGDSFLWDPSNPIGPGDEMILQELPYLGGPG